MARIAKHNSLDRDTQVESILYTEYLGVSKVLAIQYMLGSVHSRTRSITKTRQSKTSRAIHASERGRTNPMLQKQHALTGPTIAERIPYFVRSLVGGTTVIGNGEIETWNGANLDPHTLETCRNGLSSALPWSSTSVLE